MRLSELIKSKETLKSGKFFEELKKQNNKSFSKEAEQVCLTIFQKKIVYKKSLTKHFKARKKEQLIPFIDEGRELFRITVLKKLGGYL